MTGGGVHLGDRSFLGWVQGLFIVCPLAEILLLVRDLCFFKIFLTAQ